MKTTDNNHTLYFKGFIAILWLIILLMAAFADKAKAQITAEYNYTIDLKNAYQGMCVGMIFATDEDSVSLQDSLRFVIIAGNTDEAFRMSDAFVSHNELSNAFEGDIYINSIKAIRKRVYRYKLKVAVIDRSGAFKECMVYFKIVRYPLWNPANKVFYNEKFDNIFDPVY